MSAITGTREGTRPLARARLADFPGIRFLEHNLMVYRRTWRASAFTTFLSPILFLSAMGIGLGSFVDRNATSAFEGISYLAFLAPGLLAANAMQTAAIESTWPIMAGIKWLKTYDAVLATPQGPRDLVLGHIYWVILRLAIVSGIFLLVMLAFGAVSSPLVVLAWPAAILTGLAFAAPIAAFTATQENETKFNALFRFVIAPLFLFSGTFFPISQLPDLIEPLAYLTPLYHGVALTRGFALGRVDPLAAALHLAVLLAFIVVGVALAFVAYRRRLVR